MIEVGSPFPLLIHHERCKAYGFPSARYETYGDEKGNALPPFSFSPHIVSAKWLIGEIIELKEVKSHRCLEAALSCTKPRNVGLDIQLFFTKRFGYDSSFFWPHSSLKGGQKSIFRTTSFLQFTSCHNLTFLSIHPFSQICPWFENDWVFYSGENIMPLNLPPVQCTVVDFLLETALCSVFTETMSDGERS